jgi:hypothetical protein
MSANAYYEVLWPGGPIGVPVAPPAPRPASLAGRRVAFLWDYMFRGEEVFPAIERGLRQAFGEIDIAGYDRFGSVFGGDEEHVLASLPARLRAMEVDAVVCGIGC